MADGCQELRHVLLALTLGFALHGGLLLRGIVPRIR